MLDEMFPTAPSSKKNEFRNPLHPDSNDNDDEDDDPNDASAPDFDELTKRFEALKKRQ